MKTNTVTRRIVFIFMLLYLCVFLFGCQEKPLYKESRVMMATYVEVVSEDERASEIAFSEIAKIEKLASDYDPASEISKLNKTGILNASPEIFDLIAKSKDFWQGSNGAFDVTVRPLMEIWGFKDKNYRVPSQAEIDDALKKVGSDKIILHRDNNLVELTIPGMQIDLGGIAKGFAVDCAIKKLREAGVKNCLVRAGGSIYGLGKKSGQPWKVAIQHPRQDKILRILEISDQGVDTSGDYEQYFNQGASHYAHIMDPKTGKPEVSGVIATTIIAPDCATADALATAICVLGKEKGSQLAKKYPGVETIILEEKDVSGN